MIRKVSTSVICGEHPDAEGGELADQERREERAEHAAHAADHDHDEGVGDDPQVHVVGDRVARQLERAAQGSEAGAEREHRGEQPGLVDAERADHLAVLGRGAHQDAPAGVPEQRVERAQHQRPERDQHQLVLGKALAEDRDPAVEAGGARPDQVLGPPER